MEYKKCSSVYGACALIVISLSGCGSSSESGSSPVTDKPGVVVPPVAVEPPSVEPPPVEPPVVEPPPVVKPVPEMTALHQQVEHYIDNTTQWFTDQQLDCTVEVEQRHALCEPVLVKFSDGHFSQQRVDSKQTILVLDTGMALQSVLRYRSRIRATYRYDAQTQRFVEGDPSIAISGVGKKLLSELDQFTFTAPEQTEPRPGFVPAAWLADLAKIYTSKVPDDAVDYESQVPHVSHGTMVLGYLAEHNPKAEFVLLDTGQFLPFALHKDLVCDKAVNALLAKMQTAADSLTSDVIQQHGVEFINFSGGYTQGHVRNIFNKHCEGQLTEQEGKALLLAAKPIYDAMFAAPNTLGVQSGIRKIKGANEHSHALDALSYPHRTTVYTYTSAQQDTPLDISGQANWRSVLNDYAEQFEGHDFIDLFVNFGIGGWLNPEANNSTPKMQSDVFGMRYAPERELHASWAAPVVTSYAVYIQSVQRQQDENWAFSPAFIKAQMMPSLCPAKPDDTDKIKAYVRQSEACRIQDPLKFRADELNRLKYLDF
ncbi:hypothetical protein L1285_08790 [Pseudoalteromonas sp. DL2-H2.2]|uniref:hypothetical protein n=1 Tax=Pseudoalteromonas sp. DL2-H2.2 TaxID=2908889 RepID=UPI001F411EA8|nr:hypothetical protein [Pseudoalteromonas sp. DL2-H2.2]MCF2908418.1 hypothetical protein [Pseudoalteromonas sp. DL2-H2.2]